MPGSIWDPGTLPDTLRADLISAVAGKGASLVMTESGLTVEEVLASLAGYTGPWYASINGTVTTVRFGRNATTGMFFPSGNQISWATNGVERLNLAALSHTLNLGPNVSTESVVLNLASGRSGNGSCAIQLVGDATYTAGALRLTRGNTGANAVSSVQHRGTGTFDLTTTDAADIRLVTSNTESLRVNSAGQTIASTSSFTERPVDDGAFTPILSVVGDRTTSATRVGAAVTQFSAVSQPPAKFTLARGYGNNAGVYTAIANSTTVGELRFDGSDGTDFSTGAIIAASTAALAQADDVPMNLDFYTKIDGGLMTLKARIAANNPHLQIGPAVVAEDTFLTLGFGRTGSGNNEIRLVGDTTYSTAGTSILRSSGANGGTTIRHRGTGPLALVTQEAAEMTFYTGNALRLVLEDDGRLYGTALHNNAGSVSGPTEQHIASGTYTPTLTGILNVAAFTAKQCQWTRVGNVVSVSGGFDVDPTAASANTTLGLTLPIPSNFTNIAQANGSGSAFNTAGEAWGVIADTVNDRVTFGSFVSNAANHGITFTFQYEIL